MLKFLTINLVFVFTCISAKAISSLEVTPDTSGKPWKLKKIQFVDRFGKDDTSKAIIDYWYLNRRSAPLLAYLSGLGSAITGTAILVTVGKPKTPNGPDDYGGLFALAGTFFLLPLFLIFSLSILLLLKMSRKKLYRHLINYEAGKPLPAEIRKPISKFMKRRKVRS